MLQDALRSRLRQRVQFGLNRKLRSSGVLAIVFSYTDRALSLATVPALILSRYESFSFRRFSAALSRDSRCCLSAILDGLRHSWQPQ
eukprot:5122674-Prymnesium_polylepis.1